MFEIYNKLLFMATLTCVRFVTQNLYDTLAVRRKKSLKENNLPCVWSLIHWEYYLTFSNPISI